MLRHSRGATKKKEDTLQPPGALLSHILARRHQEYHVHDVQAPARDQEGKARTILVVSLELVAVRRG